MTFNKKTSKEIKILVGQCSVCYRKSFMIISDNTRVSKGLGDFFNSLGAKGLKVSRKRAKIVLKNPGRALESGADVCTAFASRSQKADSSTLRDENTFY